MLTFLLLHLAALAAFLIVAEAQADEPRSTVLTSVVVFVDYQPVVSTSTVFATQYFTVLQCPPDVTNCPARSVPVVTATVPVSTTVCPLTLTSTYVGKITTTTSLPLPSPPVPTSEVGPQITTPTITRTLSSTLTLPTAMSSTLSLVLPSQSGGSSTLSIFQGTSSDSSASIELHSLSFTNAFASSSSGTPTTIETRLSVSDSSVTATPIGSLSSSVQTSVASNLPSLAPSASPSASFSPLASSTTPLTLSTSSSTTSSVVFSQSSSTETSGTVYSSTPLSTITRTLSSTATVPGIEVTSLTAVYQSCDTCPAFTTLVPFTIFPGSSELPTSHSSARPTSASNFTGNISVHNTPTPTPIAFTGLGANYHTNMCACALLLVLFFALGL